MLKCVDLGGRSYIWETSKVCVWETHDVCEREREGEGEGGSKNRKFICGGQCCSGLPQIYECTCIADVDPGRFFGLECILSAQFRLSEPDVGEALTHTLFSPPYHNSSSEQTPTSYLVSFVLLRCRCPAGDKVPLCKCRGVFLQVQQNPTLSLTHTHSYTHSYIHAPSRTDFGR